MFTIKSVSRRLARQASLSGHDPYLTSDGTTAEAREETGFIAVATPEASTSWGSQLKLAADPLQEEDILELDYGDDEDAASKLLISEDKGLHSPQPPSPLGMEMRVAHQLLLSPARTCSTCANALLPGWPSPGPLSLLRPPDPTTRGRNCPWPRVRQSNFSPSSQSCLMR